MFERLNPFAGILTERLSPERMFKYAFYKIHQAFAELGESKVVALQQPKIFELGDGSTLNIEIPAKGVLFEKGSQKVILLSPASDLTEIVPGVNHDLSLLSDLGLWMVDLKESYPTAAIIIPLAQGVGDKRHWVQLLFINNQFYMGDPKSREWFLPYPDPLLEANQPGNVTGAGVLKGYQGVKRYYSFQSKLDPNRCGYFGGAIISNFVQNFLVAGDEKPAAEAILDCKATPNGSELVTEFNAQARNFAPFIQLFPQDNLPAGEARWSWKKTLGVGGTLGAIFGVGLYFGLCYFFPPLLAVMPWALPAFASGGAAIGAAIAAAIRSRGVKGDNAGAGTDAESDIVDVGEEYEDGRKKPPSSDRTVQEILSSQPPRSVSPPADGWNSGSFHTPPEDVSVLAARSWQSQPSAEDPFQHNPYATYSHAHGYSNGED